MGRCGGRASANERCGPGPEKLNPATAVRYGRLRHIGEFSYPPDMPLTCGAKVVITTERGIEIGEQVPFTCFGCDLSASREQMRAYAQRSGEDAYRLKNGRILREATPADLTELRHLEAGAREKLTIARELAAKLDLPMKIVDCEHVFGGERIVFYFMADERIDFRELVRGLAGEFQTRIEMRQVGARDEARLLADFETCGRECCCRHFLKSLKPIGMQMAKLQKATLDPSKVSGRCGRLKCCLRYEHDTYESLARQMPRLGARVGTKEGVGRVVERQVLTQLVRIADDDGRFFVVAVEDIVDRHVREPDSAAGSPSGDAEAETSDRSTEAENTKEDKVPTGDRDEAWTSDAGVTNADNADDTDGKEDQPSEGPPSDAGGTEVTPGPGSQREGRSGRRRRRGRGRRSYFTPPAADQTHRSPPTGPRGQP